MVSPSRSSASRRRRDDAGKFFTGILILLGLVASVFLVFSDNVQMVRVGLVAALWAAAIGALAATRYRRESAVDKAKVGDLQKVYQLQLEREVAARREYELGVESRVRREVGVDNAELAGLRAELTVLRESLQRLFDGDLDFERPALRADAVRVQELPSSNLNTSIGTANGNWPDATPWDPWESGPLTPVFDVDHPEPPAFASPYDEPVTAETSVVSSADYDRARAEYASTREQFDAKEHSVEFGDEDFSAIGDLDDDKNAAREATAATVGHHDVADKGPTDGTRRTEPHTGLERDRAQQVAWFETDPADAEAAKPAPTAPPTPDPKQSPATATTGPRPTAPPAPRPTTPIGTASSRRRRRADEDDNPDTSGRLSVAEIMANLRSEGSK